MFGNDRARMRAYFQEVWRKRSAGTPLEPLENVIVSVIEMHPEYHPTLLDGASLTEDFEGPNPYLHMGMHIALHEQLGADRPPGVRKLYQRVGRRFPDRHAAEHAMMDCLREVMLEAQSRGGELDATSEAQYLRALKSLAKGSRRA